MAIITLHAIGNNFSQHSIFSASHFTSTIGWPLAPKG